MTALRALEYFLMLCGAFGIADVLFFKGIIGVVMSRYLDLSRFVKR